MIHERYFTCDLCDTRYGSHSECNNATSVEGKQLRLYSDVCDKCIKRLVRMIDKTFPNNNKVGMKANISAGAIPTTPSQSVQLYQ